MRETNSYLAGGALALVLFFPGMAQAMEIVDFDALSDANKVNYMAFLVEGTCDAWKAQGKTDDAKKLVDLFTSLAPNKKAPLALRTFSKERTLIVLITKSLPTI